MQPQMPIIRALDLRLHGLPPLVEANWLGFTEIVK
jgi:hypothetical protein